MNRQTLQLAAVIVMSLCAWGIAQDGDRTEPAPPQTAKVAIVERLGGELPLDATFTDQTGKTVKLGDYFTGKRPVVLSLIYLNCPQLCSLVLNGMLDGLKDVPLKPGVDYDLLTVSFDPTESSELAARKRAAYVAQFGQPGADKGWTFLTGDATSIRRLTEAVGFGHEWVESEKQFAHQAAIYVVTPDGHLSRYLYGVVFEPSTLRLSLVEAGKGMIGSTVDRFMLTCYVYDPASGSYAASAMAMVRWGGAATVALLAVLVGLFAWIGRHRRAVVSLPQPNA